MGHNLLPLLEVELICDEKLVFIEYFYNNFPVGPDQVVIGFSCLLHKLSEELNKVLVHYFLLIVLLVQIWGGRRKHLRRLA